MTTIRKVFSLDPLIDLKRKIREIERGLSPLITTLRRSISSRLRHVSPTPARMHGVNLNPFIDDSTLVSAEDVRVGAHEDLGGVADGPWPRSSPATPDVGLDAMRLQSVEVSEGEGLVVPQLSESLWVDRGELSEVSELAAHEDDLSVGVDQVLLEDLLGELLGVVVVGVPLDVEGLGLIWFGSQVNSGVVDEDVDLTYILI